MTGNVFYKSRHYTPFDPARRLASLPFCATIRPYLGGSVAQGLEQGTHNPLVVGSKPTGPTKYRSLDKCPGFFFCAFYHGSVCLK